MHPIAFSIGPKEIHWYGVFIALGFFGALMIVHLKRKHAGATPEQCVEIMMQALFGGIIGARLFYVVQDWESYFSKAPFLEIFRVDKGGLVFYGGFLLAFTSICIYAYVKKFSVPRILDICAPAVAFGHAFGRIGCFLQGCCFGRPSDAWYAVVFPAGSAPAERYPSLTEVGCSLPLIPVQLFEAGLNLLLCALLLIMFRYVKKGGQIAALYLIAYAVLRFSLEFMRGDHTDSVMGMTPSQSIALFLMLPLGIGLFLYLGKIKEKNHVSN